MRIALSDNDRLRLFTALLEKGFDIEKLALLTGVSKRTVFNWKCGKYTMPSLHFKAITQLAGLDSEAIKPQSLAEWWNNGRAGKKGALVRELIHGPLGTPEGRRRGGIATYTNYSSAADSIFTPKAIRKPKRSKALAEFIGVLIGDGSITRYQVAISTNSIDDYEYGLYVACLAKTLFNIRAAIHKRKNQNCIVVVLSSVELVKFLGKQGLLPGHKLRRGLDMPQWIFANPPYAKACLRGIFDTDGCIFQERHRIKGKFYSYPRLSFVSKSENLRRSIEKTLISLDFSPKLRNNRSVNLEKRQDIIAYFKTVGTSNSKHRKRFRGFGGVG